MRSAIRLFLFILAIQSAQAGDCVVSGGARPALNSETLEWSFEIASGRTCLRGLRSGAMILDSVRVSTPAKNGEATTKGYAFSYQAPASFKGEDEFVVTMSGTNRGVRGTSTIHVNVSVR